MVTTIHNRVYTIIAEELDVDPGDITLDAQLRGNRLRADSMDLVSLVMAFADEFDVDIRDEEVRRIVTVGDVIRYLEKRLNPRDKPEKLT